MLLIKSTNKKVGQLALALLVASFFADHSNNTVSTNNFSVAADLFN